jgi:iron complex transport system substrate-binding protein
MPQTMHARLPQRIVCLTEEPTEILCRQQDRIVGSSGLTVRPPQARKEKPEVAAFTTAKLGKILDLESDLVVGCSDLQADITAGLIREGVQTLITNQPGVPSTRCRQARTAGWGRERKFLLQVA